VNNYSLLSQKIIHHHSQVGAKTSDLISSSATPIRPVNLCRETALLTNQAAFRAYEIVIQSCQLGRFARREFAIFDCIFYEPMMDLYEGKQHDRSEASTASLAI
jgi:hypothetical protein